MELRFRAEGEPLGPGIRRVRDLLGDTARVGVRKDASAPDARAALAREVGELVRLRHPALRGVLAAGEGCAVLEHVEGDELGAYLARAPEDALACAVGLLRALLALHSQDRVHGDLKPAN